MKRRNNIIIIAILILCFYLASCGKAEDSNETNVSSEESKSEITTEITENSELTEDSEKTEKIEKNEQSDTESETDTIEISESDEETGTEEEEVEEVGNAVLYYQGHASVRITTAEGKVIYVDPFMGDGYDIPADLILVTHGHYDHTATDLIKNCNDGCQTITYEEALEGGSHQTFDLGYVKVEAVEAGYNKNHSVKNCVGYIITFIDNVSIYLSGDTSKTDQMAELAERNINYAFFCCDGVYNMDTTEATECAKLVNAQHSIPYHMVPATNTNGFDMDVAETFDGPGRIIIQPGEELDLK